jgi:nuclear GTP-binding protein
MVLNDFMRGRIPWFTPPPSASTEDADAVNGRKGRLGEMPLKRKADDVEDTATKADAESASEVDEEEFEGFGSATEDDARSKNTSFTGATTSDSDSEVEGDAIVEASDGEGAADDSAPVPEPVTKAVTRASKRRKV